MALGIEARSRVSVPILRFRLHRSPLQTLGPTVQFPDPMELVHARLASGNDDYVEMTSLTLRNFVRADLMRSGL